MLLNQNIVRRLSNCHLTSIESSEFLGEAGVGRRGQVDAAGQVHSAHHRLQFLPHFQVVARAQGKQVGSRVQLVGQVIHVRWDGAGVHEVGGEGRRVGQGRDGQAVGVGSGHGVFQRWE